MSYFRSQKTCILYYLGTKRSGGGHCGCDQHTKHGQEELRHVRGQGQRPRVPDCDGAGTAERSYAPSEVRGGGQEELPHAPKPEARGSGREEQPHVQGAVAAQAQEGLEELSHVEGQEGQR